MEIGSLSSAACREWRLHLLLLLFICMGEVVTVLQLALLLLSILINGVKLYFGPAQGCYDVLFTSFRATSQWILGEVFNPAASESRNAKGNLT